MAHLRTCYPVKVFVPGKKRLIGSNLDSLCESYPVRNVGAWVAGAIPDQAWGSPADTGRGAGKSSGWPSCRGVEAGAAVADLHVPSWR